MTVCKYYLNGSCKFGDRCRFEHVDANGGSTGSAMADPFAQPGGADGHNKRHAARGGKRQTNVRDTPQWPLSSVGAHPLSSGNTLTGDISQEELRAQAYASAPHTRGCSDEVVLREQTLVAEFQQRNNGAPAPVAHAPATDPFAGHSGSHASGRQQQPIFGGSHAPAPQNAPIFPTAASAQPGTGVASRGDVFSSAHGQAPYRQPGVMATPPAAPSSSIVSTPPVTAEQPQFAFQRVPETAPKPVFR